MKISFRIYMLLFSVGLLSACSGFDVSNPFITSADVKSTYISQFPDVPIPIDMSSDNGKTFVTVNSDGMKVGVETLKGGVEFYSLAQAMEYNLAENWDIVASLGGEEIMQVFQKEERYLVVILKNGIFGSTMELWMLNKRDIDVESAFGGYFTPYEPSGPVPKSNVESNSDLNSEKPSDKNQNSNIATNFVNASE